MSNHTTNQQTIELFHHEFGAQSDQFARVAERLLSQLSNAVPHSSNNALEAARELDKKLSETSAIDGLTHLVITTHKYRESLKDIPELIDYANFVLRKKHGLSESEIEVLTQVMQGQAQLVSVDEYQRVVDKLRNDLMFAAAEVADDETKGANSNDVQLSLEEIKKFNFDQIIDACSAVGITRAEVIYAGSGDAGNVETISFEPNDVETNAIQVVRRTIQSVFDSVIKTTTCTLVDKVVPLEDALEAFFEDDCENYDINFNNDGCDGCYSIEVSTREVCVENKCRTSQTENYRTKY